MIGKQVMERMCRAAGMMPVKREHIGSAYIFIADGFAARPDVAFQRFGIGPADFPNGCYATMWWCSKSDENLDAGRQLFFEPGHDPEISASNKQRARINRALTDAREFLDHLKKAKH